LRIHAFARSLAPQSLLQIGKRPALVISSLNHVETTRMRVALLEVSHWHVPLYLDALEAPGIEVVAVSDAEDVKGEAIAARFGSKLYSSAYELLEREEVDFAFVF